MSFAPPRRSPAAAAARSCLSARAATSLLEVLRPFGGLWSRSFARSFPVLRTAGLHRSSNVSRVLSPSSRPPASTCRACSIPAPPLGFCLQRSVQVLSRTPFGWPCPAFPSPFESILRSCSSGSRRPIDWPPCGALSFSRLAGHVRVFTQPPSRPVCLHTLGFQGCSREPVRISGALFKRLPDSHLSWPSIPPGFDSDDLGLDFATPPLTLLPYRAGRCWSLRVSIDLHCGRGGASNRSPSSVPSASPSWAFYPRTDA